MNIELIKQAFEKYPFELDDPYNEAIKAIGIENLLKLSECLASRQIYFKSPRAIFRKSINRQIRQEFNGYNYQQLAAKYDLCEHSIRNIVDGKQ